MTEKKANFSESAAKKLAQMYKAWSGQQGKPIGTPVKNYVRGTIGGGGGEFRLLEACKAEGESTYQITFEDWTKNSPDQPLTWTFRDGKWDTETDWETEDEPTYFEVINLTRHFIPETKRVLCFKQPTTDGDKWFCSYYLPQTIRVLLTEDLVPSGSAEGTLQSDSLDGCYLGDEVTVTVYDIFGVSTLAEGVTVMAHLNREHGPWRYIVGSADSCGELES